MSRPKPEILMNNYNPDSEKTEEVLRADAIYAVYYDGNPINLRTVEHALSVIHGIPKEKGPKYKKCSFSNPGHAFNLADRLNSQFNTKGFGVFKLVVGEKLTESL